MSTLITKCDHSVGTCAKCLVRDYCNAPSKELDNSDCECPVKDAPMVVSHECPVHGAPLAMPVTAEELRAKADPNCKNCDGTGDSDPTKKLVPCYCTQKK